MSIKKIMHKDRHGAQVSIEFGEGGPAAQLVEQFLGGMGVPAMQDIPQEHPGNPKGTDTVPAWLTPGEFVMNAEATRMFEPQIEEMNNAGRAVQRQQGGSIPEYKAEGGSIPEYYNDGGMAGSWLNDNVLDALLMTESGGDFNAVSPAGARGGYQIMPATAANPGYGVTPISSEDVLDPMKSREFARQYIMGIAKANPNATQQEVLQMYNAGPNRVKGANANNPLTQETLDYPGKIEAAMALNKEPPVDNDYLASVGLGPTLTQEENLRRVLGPSTIDSLDNPPLEVPKPDGPMMKPMGNVTTKQKAERALDRRREVKEAGYPGQQAALDNLTTSFKDIYKPKNWQAREALSEEEVVPAIDPYRIEVDVDAINNAEPSDDDKTISGLIDAGNRAKEVETPEGEGSNAWDKVKDFFKEGFATVLDKGALSEAATIYLGSRALGYDHEGSLNFVAKRYGKGIEDKLAIANKAVGTHTPESITKYKDTGNLNDLVLIKTLTDTNETEYWTDPKTGDEITLRVAKDEKGRKVLVDPDDNPVDTKNFLKASEFKSRDEYNQKQIKSIMSPKLRKFELDNDMAKGEGEAIINIPEVAQAMSMYSIQNGFNTAKVNELSDYVFNSILETRSDAKNKKMSDRDLTNLALQKGIARQMEKDMFVKPNGNPVEPTVTGEILALMDGLPKDPVPQGQMLKTMFHHGYMTRTPDERKRFTMDAKGRTSGYLEYLRQQGYIADRDNWVPAWRSLNGQ